MKKINLTKYGFIRTPEKDFTDDGNRFTCYSVGKVRVSKLVSNGDVYIDARINDCELHYYEYKDLPHCKDLSALNGVPLESISDEDLIKLYNDCIEYEKEYTQKSLELKKLNPSYETILSQLKSIQGARKKELDDIISKFDLISFSKLDSYSRDRFISYFNTLKGLILDDDKIKATAQYDSENGNGYTRRNYSDQSLSNILMPSYWYKECLELLQK